MTASDGPRRRLEAAGGVLLDRRAEPGDLHAAAQALHALLTELTGLREDSRERAETEPIRLPSGVALAPRDAARSVVDFMRTARILQGLSAAIDSARARFGAPVEVLYAGCGPFAPLALPLAARLGPGAARYTLLDVHQTSIDMARRAVEALGLGPCVRTFVRADATTWQSPGPAPQVVVVEALGRALEKEPQVRILANLAPQLAPGGLVVPESIAVQACLAHQAREIVSLVEAPAERRRVVLGTVFELNAGTARELALGQPVPSVRFVVPDLGPDDPRDLMLGTTITVFGDVVLREYESGITYPAFQHRAGRVRAGTAIAVRYQEGPDPRFECPPEAEREAPDGDLGPV